MNVSFPTDLDGFLSQECPSCSQRFKTLFGEGSDEPVSFCPYCGYRGLQCWLTPEQAEYAKAVAINKLMKTELKGLKVSSNVSRHPQPPMEVDGNFEILRFPCCNETVKVTRHDKLFCIICGGEINMAVSDSKKVFLSHKGDDKAMVLDFKETLAQLGFDPWLDDHAMPAGTTLERGLAKGMEESCGVVFFITPSFKDEGFLETEINYAIQEKREKGDKFAIITLQFQGPDGEIPRLLKPYVWKKPKSHLEALREIIWALPIEITGVDWKAGVTGVVTLPKQKSTTTELSAEAKAILKAAVEGDGHVMHTRTSSGTQIQAGNKSMIPDQSSRTVALWIGGLEDLQRRRFIRDLGSGQVFEVTREGHEAADATSINH